MKLHSYCEVHNTLPGPDEPCWQCVNKWNAELEAENAKLKEEYGEATDTIQDLIDMLKDTQNRLQKSNCPHAIAAGAWISQALKEPTDG